jgi:hypothetical protein
MLKGFKHNKIQLFEQIVKAFPYGQKMSFLLILRALEYLYLINFKVNYTKPQKIV